MCRERAFIATAPQALQNATGGLIRCVKPCSSEHGQDRQPLDHRHRLGGGVPLFCRGATIGLPTWMRPDVGEGEAQIAQVVLQRARALYLKSARGRGQKSLLLCHGRYASPRFRRWQIGAAILRYLRIPPIVPCDFGGSRRRPRFEGYRGFRQRKAVREELRQCIGF